mgnify:CR=1 FL=1
MSKGGPVSENEEVEILEALKSGKSQNQTAKDFDRAPDTIHRIADRHGLVYTGPKKANEARSCYASAERIKLIGEALNKGRELLKSCDSPRDFQYLMTGFAIGIDKRRLEEGPGYGDKAGEIKKLFEKMETDEPDDGAPMGAESGG